MNATPNVWDTNESINFLKTLDDDGRHNLVAIDPATEEIDGRTFAPDSWADIFRWIERWQGKRNLYYSVNEPLPDAPDKKLGKAQIGKLRALHLDIDPPKDASQSPDELEIEREAIRTKIQDEIQTHPENFATTIINSGGGYQCLWKLNQKLDAGDSTEAVEALNRSLVKKFDGDTGTVDVSRVFRLPGTFNMPTAKKRKRGRITTRACIVEDTENTVSLDEMSDWAPPVAAPRSVHSKADTADVSIDMAAVEDVLLSGILPAEIQEKLDHLLDEDEKFNRLWHGDKPAVGGLDTSGSAFGFALASRLRKTGQFTATEYGQILASWEHSSENLDERQIARAWIRSRAAAAAEEFSEVFALPLEWVEPFEAESIPRRRFVIGRFVARQHVTALISPPGVGKTTFLLMLAVAIATGRGDITGFRVSERTRVFLWNQEDELDELKRRLLAVMTAFDVKWRDMEIDGKPGIMLGSGVDHALMIAKKDNDKISASADASYLEGLIKENGVGVAIFDPFVELHPANENDNVEIAAVARVFRRIAVRGECGVVLAHHTRKPPNAANRESFAGDMDMGRGAGSLNGVARMVVTLYTLDTATAKKYGIAEADAKKHIRLDDGKANMSLVSAEPRFFRREGVTIGGLGGEEIGVLRPVKLSRAKSATEAKADEDALARETIRDILQKEPARKLPVTRLAARLIELGTIELVSPDTLTKRIKKIFSKPVSYDNGDTIKLIENGTIPGERGRKALLIAEFAENAKQHSGNFLPSSNFAE